MNIPALSLWRPWPKLILEHGKSVENRGWPTSYRGPLWVHAGQRWQDLDLDWIEQQGIDGRVAYLPAEHPVGIVGLVDLIDICRARLDGVGECECGPWAWPAQCHWRLANPRPLPEAVACRGMQGLWYPRPETLAAITALGVAF
jgi:hypothetical protein